MNIARNCVVKNFFNYIFIKKYTFISQEIIVESVLDWALFYFLEFLSLFIF